MADQKVSGLPPDSSLDGNHYFPLNDPVGPTTKRTLLSTLAAWLFNQINIPAGSGSPITRFNEAFKPFVYSGLVITGDNYNVNRNGSMSSGTIYLNGRRLTVSAVVARTYTASRDTYVDVLDNQDGTASLVYTEVTNGAASPALAASSLRIAKVVTGATAIVASTSITQFGFDSLFNPIYPYSPIFSTGAWIVPTLLNSWQNYGGGFEDAAYFKDSLGYVQMRGMVKLGTMGASIFTLPVGYRPKLVQYHAAVSAANPGILSVDSTGVVKADGGSNGYISLSSVRFRAEN